MVAAALEALVGEEPREDAVATAVTTIPAAELPGALRLLAKKHAVAAVPLLQRCLAGRPEWGVAAADALGTVRSQAAADALAAAERHGPPKAVRTAVRRALYRLRQAGVVPTPAPTPERAAPPPPAPRQAWVSAIDGTGSRGCWLVFEGPFGERTLLSAVLNDTTGFLDFAGGPIAKKRLAERLRAIQAESPLPWVEAPPAWAARLFTEARQRHADTGTPPPAELARWQPLLTEVPVPDTPPVYSRVPPASVADAPQLLETSAALLGLQDLAGWFLDPPTVQGEALDLLQAKESRLVVSDQVKAERQGALVDRVIETQFGPDGRRLWQRRLEEQGFVLYETGRPAEARQAVAVALALADPERPAIFIPFVRALVERSLEVAGQVALGQLPAEQVRRVPPPLRAAAAP